VPAIIDVLFIIDGDPEARRELRWAARGLSILFQEEPDAHQLLRWLKYCTIEPSDLAQGLTIEGWQHEAFLVHTDKRAIRVLIVHRDLVLSQRLRALLG
jgi:hypothetical protein